MLGLAVFVIICLQDLMYHEFSKYGAARTPKTGMCRGMKQACLGMMEELSVG